MEELMDLFEFLDGVPDSASLGSAGEFFSGGDTLAEAVESGVDAILPPWFGQPSAAYEDWDGDGIPNYADYWFGPGAQGPYESADGAAADGRGTLPGDSWQDAQTPVLLEAFDDVEGAEILGPGAELFIDTPDGLGADATTPAEMLTLGDPYRDALYWQPQGSDASCAVATQAMVLESIFNREFPEQELAQVAQENGWYDPISGTDPNDLGNLIEHHGVSVICQTGTSWQDVRDAWGRGEEVLVAFDANEVWSPETGLDGKPIEQKPDAGHAAWLTGLQRDERGEWHVVMNDPGIPSGRAQLVPLDVFDAAWEDFDYRSAITLRYAGTSNVT